jgi:hypothetical protein
MCINTASPHWIPRTWHHFHIQSWRWQRDRHNPCCLFCCTCVSLGVLAVFTVASLYHRGTSFCRKDEFRSIFSCNCCNSHSAMFQNTSVVSSGLDSTGPGLPVAFLKRRDIPFLKRRSHSRNSNFRSFHGEPPQSNAWSTTKENTLRIRKTVK